MNGCLAAKFSGDEESVSVLQELFKLSISLVSKPEDDLPVILPTHIEQRSLVVKSVLVFLAVVVDTYADLLNRREELSKNLQKTVKSVIEVGGLPEPGMGQRTESGQLAFESDASNKLVVTNEKENSFDNEAEDCNNEASGTNVLESKMDGAVSSFLSLLKAKCPSLVIGTC